MNQKLSRIAGARGGWFTRSDALDCGYSLGEIHQRLRTGQWARLCRDAYVEPGGWPVDEPPWVRAERIHALMARAVYGRLGPGVAISHQSAALLHGLPSWGLSLERVQVTRSTGRVRSDRTLQTHRSPLGPGDVVQAQGISLTSPARAIAEAACTSTYEVGVVLADAALREGLSTGPELVEMADRFSRWRGSPAARAAARFADGRAESVGESRLRVLMADQGVPAPALQVDVRDAHDQLLGRVDFMLADTLIVEFDGALKYDDAAALTAEKWREDRMRALGFSFLRFGWADLGRPQHTGQHIRRALGHCGHQTGTSDNK